MFLLVSVHDQQVSLFLLHFVCLSDQSLPEDREKTQQERGAQHCEQRLETGHQTDEGKHIGHESTLVSALTCEQY